jgi:cytochrome c-type biogenesis protein
MVFIEGILTFISPCILPMLPIYFIYLAGSAIEEEKYKRTLIINSISFVLGITVIFTALGATATALGGLLNNNIDLFRKISGVIIIIFGLYFLGIIKINLFDSEKKINKKVEGKSILAAFLLGVIFAFGWSPCVGPFLASVLLMSANSETLTEGMTLLIIYSLGLGLPFILTAILFDHLKGFINKIKEKQNIIKIISGIILIIMGILFLTNKISFLIPV